MMEIFKKNWKNFVELKKGFEETYENIVIAKQNEFINIFKAKPKDREEIFNKILILKYIKKCMIAF